MIDQQVKEIEDKSKFTINVRGWKKGRRGCGLVEGSYLRKPLGCCQTIWHL
jgi:hypothetical protein